MKQSIKNNALLIAIAAMYAALMVGGKEALAAIPNVEVVTLLVAIAAFTWGPAVVFFAVNVFIAVDAAIWSINTWVISYFIHFNLVALCFWLLSKARFKKNAVTVVFATLLAVGLTALFGVLTSAVDTVIGYTGKGFFFDFENVAYRFAAVYVAGVWYYLTHVLCNLALFAAAFLPLVLLNKKFSTRVLAKDDQPSE